MLPHQPWSTPSASSISVISLTSLTKSRFLDLDFSTWHLLPFCQARHPSTCQEDSKSFQTQKQSKRDVTACYSTSSIGSFDDGSAEMSKCTTTTTTTNNPKKDQEVQQLQKVPLISLASAGLGASTAGVPLGSLRSSSNSLQSLQSLLEKPSIVMDRGSGAESRKSRIRCKCKKKFGTKSV